MALNIKNLDVERLAGEVARMTGETKPGAIKRALAERKQRLAHRVDLADRHGRTLRSSSGRSGPPCPPARPAVGSAPRRRSHPRLRPDGT